MERGGDPDDGEPVRTSHVKGHLFKVVATAMLWMLCHVAHAGTHHYYYTDPQGTVLAKADASGTIVATYDYAPYGTAVASMSPAPNGPGYTGHVNDPDTGLVYMQARYYDPAVGRFLSVDPVSAVAKFSRYTYASNNPITNIDPDGMSDIPFGDCSKNPNCSHSFISGSDGGGTSSGAVKSTFTAPVGTPDSMKKYFVGTSASDRIKAAMAVMNYYSIDYHGVNFFYDAPLHDYADTLKDGPNGDGQTTIGESLFKLSFGYIGAVLSHEIEGHWQMQWSAPGMRSSETQAFSMREVQAFRMELSQTNVSRFGLTQDEVHMENVKLKTYYDYLSPANKRAVDRREYVPF